MPDVSIIIVSWNAKRYLLDCARSIEEHPGDASREIIVVDNLSSDGSPDAVAREFPQVNLIRNFANLGFAKGNNVGIKRSAGRYVALVNSDVIVLEGCLDRLIAFMDEHPGVGVCAPRILNGDRTLQPSCRRFPTFFSSLSRALALDSLFPNSAAFAGSFMVYWAHDTLREVDAVSGCFMVVRREALDRVGLLDDGFWMYGEDVDWCKRFHDAGWKIMFNPDAQAIHFGGASSSNAPVRFFVEMQKADLRYWRKHHGRLGQAFYAATLFFHQTLRLAGELVKYLVRPSRRAETSPKIQRSLACIQWLLHI